MDGENNGKPYFLMEGFPIFLETPTSIFQTYVMFIRYFLATWYFPHAFKVILWSGVLLYGRFFERVGFKIGY